MSICKTGADHIKSLQDGRAVYLDGGLPTYATEASRNSTTAAAGDIVSGHSVTLLGTTTNGTLDLGLYVLKTDVVSTGSVVKGIPTYSGGPNGDFVGIADNDGNVFGSGILKSGVHYTGGILSLGVYYATTGLAADGSTVVTGTSWHDGDGTHTGTYPTTAATQAADAATLSITTISTAPDRTRVSAISRACSPVSG